MKRQTRQFIVEVKHKRGNPKQSRSIWGDLDLSAIVAETTRETEKETWQPQRQLVDSHVTPPDVEDGHQPRTEHLMADPKEDESAQTPTEVPATREAAVTKKKVPRAKAAKAQPERPARKAATKPVPATTDASTTVRKARSVYSEKERGQLLGQIEKSIGRGESVKNATSQASISEQTYYQWKKSAAPASDGGDLKDLLALEEENARLKKLLADRLRKENAELKKKLGL